MRVLPVNTEHRKTNFEHGHSLKDSNYTAAQKAIIATTTALGVAGSLALLAKKTGHSLKPSKMFSNIKNSYLAKVKYEEKEVITIGAGSCLGGLVGGYIVDKNPDNRKAKRRETVMQIGNISIPILTVEGFANIGKRFNKFTKSAFAVAGIFVGVYLANFLMNILSNVIFKSNNGARGVKASDFSAHLDDAVVAASYISDAKPVHNIARIIPLALMFAGNEVGNKESEK